MNKHLRFIYLLLLLFGLNIQEIKAQADFASEEEFKKQAEKLFSEEEYEKAYPLYSQLVSLYRKDPNYNFRLGVCMLYASDEKERAITFLEFATQNKDVEKEAFFYRAKAYHLNYRFDDAITQYMAYKKMVSGAKAERLQVDRQIEMCKNGKKLLRNLSDLPVVEKSEVGRDDFFRAYDISEIGGKLLVKPDEKEFRTPLDKKKKEKSILYLASNGSQIYFSSYGDNEQHGKDIYLMKKTPDGEWGKPQTIGNTVNTAYDEDFPFLHPNGKVMYFCSKGHNSMGGYDIFKTTLNEETNLWSEPVNMDFPINTPDDDILYVTNVDEKKAFFASARSSVAGKIAVYHINVDRKPIDFTIIKGKIVNNHKNQALNLKITVKNATDNTIIGLFNSTLTGSYDLKLPNGGNFLFTVESPDFATQSEVVTVPVQTEFRPLKQEISFEIPTDKLLIKNIFDEAVSDSNYLLAINIIKEKSKLEVTPATELNAVDATSGDSIPTPLTIKETALVEQNVSPKTNTKLSNSDIINIAYHDASVVDTEATVSREQADIAMSFANQKNEQAKHKSQEADALMLAASKAEDNIKKQALIDEANAATKEAEKLNAETVVAFNLAKKIDATAIAKREEADLSQQYAKGLEAAVKSENSTDALAKLDELEKKLDELSRINADRFPVLNSYKKEEENKKRQLENVIQAAGYLKKDIAENETIISSLIIDAEKEKNSQVKQGLNNQIAELKLETDNKRKELEQNEKNIVKVEKEYNEIKKETELVSTVVDQSATSTSETAAANAAAIDKNKLELQVNNLKNTNQPVTDTVSSSLTNNTSASKISTDSSSTSPPIVTNTTAKAFSDINKQYATDLAAAERIENTNEREKEKAIILKNWSNAIDADVAKQKEDYISTTDPEMQAILAKKISDAEKSSIEKKKLADQSIAKVETADKSTDKDKVKATELFAVGNPTEATSMENPSTKTKNADTTTINNSSENKTPVLALTEKQSEFKENSAKEEIAKANLVDKQADTLELYAIDLKTKAAKQTNADTKKLLLEQSDDVLQQSKEKKIQAAELNGNANKKEYAANKIELDKLAKSYSTSTSDDIAMADMMNDEALIYYDKAQKLSRRADTTKSLEEKEILLKEANENEQLALAKQKKSADIYKNHTSTVASSTKNTTGNINENPSNAINSSSSKNPTLAVNKNNTDLAATEKNTTAGDKEKVLITTSDNATVKENLTNAKENQKDTSKSTSSAGNTILPVKEITTSNVQINEVANISTNPATIEKQNTYKEPEAKEEVMKAELLNKEADELMAQSVELKSQAVKQKNTNTKNTIYAQSEELIKEGQNKKLQAAQLLANANTTEFDANQNELEQLAKASSTNTSPEILKAEITNDEAKTFFDNAKQQRVKAGLTESFSAKETELEGARKNEMLALEKQKEARDIYKKYNPNFVAAAFNTENANITNNPLSSATSTKPVSNDNTPVKNSSTSEIVLSSNEVFEPKSVIDYSFKNPIPINKKLPEGLIFKVQIGAFRKPIPQNLFNGMSPITGETTPKGFIRYTVGVFEKFTTADKAKNKIIDMGYKDAFIVAFLNGKRIPINEAYAMAGGIPTNVLQINSNTVTENSQKTEDIQTTNETLPIAKAQSVSAVQGLFYTVQVGVFSQPVVAGKLYNMKPLYNEKAANGNLRYYTGIYKSVSRAAEATDIINDVGIKDAFVTAYYNGKRISLAEAKQYENQGDGIFSKDPNLNKLPIFIAETNQNPNEKRTIVDITDYNQTSSENVTSEQINKNTKQSGSSISTSGIIFKVQIGAFNEEVPLDIANKFLKISSKGIKNYTDKAGLTIYTVGNLISYEDAIALKTEVAAAELTDAFIVAFKNGEKIPVEEARQLK